MQINQLTQIRLPDGTTVAFVSWSWQPLYSSAFLNSGFSDQEFRLFSYAPGDTVTCSSNIDSGDRPTATKLHTNVQEGGEMDSTEEFIVYAIQVEIQHWDWTSGSEPSISGVNNSGVPLVGMMSAISQMTLTLEVSLKKFCEAGLGWFSTGFGPHVQMAADSSLTTAASNGVQSREAVDQWPVPVHIGGTEKFAVLLANADAATINFQNDSGSNDASATAFVRTYLTGLHKRLTG